jgi:hypothetical protein
MKDLRIIFIAQLITLMLLIPKTGNSQAIPVSDVHWRIIDKKIEVFYDLPQNKDSVEVKLAFKKDSDPNFSYSPHFLRGNIGRGIYSGKDKKIVWNIENEPDYLFTGGGFSFKITVKRIPKIEEIVSILTYYFMFLKF